MRTSALLCVGVLVALGPCPMVASAGPLLDTNILSNPGFEDATPNGWVGPYSRSSTSPYSGTYCYFAPNVTSANIYQDIDLVALGYDSVRLATGGYRVDFGGYVGGMSSIKTLGLTEYVDGGGVIPHELAPPPSTLWIHEMGTFRLAPKTSALRYSFNSVRPVIVVPNDGRLDDAYVKLNEYVIWTSGDCDDHYLGAGPWTVSGTSIGHYGKGTMNVSNGGTVNVQGVAEVGESVGGKGTINVSNGGTLNTQADAALGVGSFAGTFMTGTVNINNGTWTASGVTHVGREGKGYVTVTNGGTWDTQGEVHLAYYAASQGTVHVDNATWTTTNRAYIGQDGTGEVSVTNGGLWDARGVTYVGDGPSGSGMVNVDGGTWRASNETNIRYGEVNVTNGGTWDTRSFTNVGRLGPATVNINGGTWTASNSTTTIGQGDAGTVNVTNGGQFTVNDRRLRINSAGTLRIDGGRADLNAGLDNHGTVDLLSGVLSITGPYGGLMDIVRGGTLELHQAFGTVQEMTVNSGAVLHLDGVTYYVGPGGNLSVLGQLEFGANGGTVHLDGQHVGASQLIHSMQTLQLSAGDQIRGNGEIFVGSAGLNLGSAGDPGSVAGDPGYELVIYGDVSGSGTLSNVTLYGNLSVGSSPGIISADGLTLTGSSKLTMELGGLIAGNEHDQILVSGPFGLDGALEILWYDNFEAGLGDSFTLFDLIAGGTITGTFDSIALPGFTDVGLSWDIDSLYTDGTITAVPEPMTLVLLGLLALGLPKRAGPALLRRRRHR